jgi:hypothetical protein
MDHTETSGGLASFGLAFSALVVSHLVLWAGYARYVYAPTPSRSTNGLRIIWDRLILQTHKQRVRTHAFTDDSLEAEEDEEEVLVSSVVKLAKVGEGKKTKGSPFPLLSSSAFLLLPSSFLLPPSSFLLPPSSFLLPPSSPFLEKCLVPLSLFWSLFNQSATTWVLQAKGMNGQDLFGNVGVWLTPDQMQLWNSLFGLVLIPLFTKGIFPLFAACKLKRRGPLIQ